MKVGDVVRLRSGGPKMTIIKIDDDDGRLTCRWFSRDDSDQVSQDYFYPSTVEEIKEASRGGLF